MITKTAADILKGLTSRLAKSKKKSPLDEYYSKVLRTADPRYAERLGMVLNKKLQSVKTAEYTEELLDTAESLDIDPKVLENYLIQRGIDPFNFFSAWLFDSNGNFKDNEKVRKAILSGSTMPWVQVPEYKRSDVVHGTMAGAVAGAGLGALLTKGNPKAIAAGAGIGGTAVGAASHGYQRLMNANNPTLNVLRGDS